eukprot:TRINITY_DN3940_c0_g1_i2.p1 TRINITY_DN3940_c0_g1~~TRINITY_DN3940_c0_g1_i2.p1  ORF type:complete len:229 (+),score=50.45 TRINITY_DN3940_c0_g1_i2:81-767(+)
MNQHPPESLVSYENPVLVSEVHKRKVAKGASQVAEETLNTIVPPRRWKEADAEWIQYVSSTPATKMDVINLQEVLDAKLQQRHAREMGICPVREDLYAQTFDELIRQVTVSCVERGMLLLGIRDEVRMNINTYKTLYESSVAFGMRKALKAELLRADMENEIRNLECDNSELQARVEELLAQCQVVEQEEVERRKNDLENHEHEVAVLKKANDKLTNNLQNLLGTSKK